MFDVWLEKMEKRENAETPAEIQRGWNITLESIYGARSKQQEVLAFINSKKIANEKDVQYGSWTSL